MGKFKLKDKVDIRLLYILPSVLALAISLTALAFQFGNEIVDLKNVCYTLYLSIPDDRDPDDFLEEVCRKVERHDVSGVTASIADLGGSKIDGKFNHLTPSVELIFMDVSKNAVTRVARDLSDTYDKWVLVEEAVVKASFVPPSGESD